MMEIAMSDEILPPNTGDGKPPVDDTCDCWTCRYRRRDERDRVARAATGKFLSEAPAIADFGDLDPGALERKCQLPPSDPRHPNGFAFDEGTQTLDLFWGGYEYFIELNRLRTPEGFLGLLHHVTAKHWRAMTPERVSHLVEAMAQRNGWEIYGF
jgi:hypothetical protein